MPDDAIGESGSAEAFQPFQSPITETAFAFGAHTEKATPPPLRSCAPSFEASWRCVPSLKRKRSVALSRGVSLFVRLICFRSAEVVVGVAEIFGVARLSRFFRCEARSRGCSGLFDRKDVRWLHGGIEPDEVGRTVPGVLRAGEE